MFHWVKHRTKTEHEFCQEELSAFLDGQLTRQERLRVQKHLEQCAACRKDLASLQHTVALLRATPTVKPPRSFFIPASEKAKQRQLQRTRLAYGYLRVATTVATVLLVLVVSGDALLRFAAVAPARPMPAVVPEVRTFQAEPTPMKQVRALPTQPIVIQPSMETPTALPFTVEGAVTQHSPEPTVLAMLAPPTTGEPIPQESAIVTTDNQTLDAKAVPSQTFARSAGAPVPPTASPEAVAIASPSVEAEQPPMVSALESSTLHEATLVPTDTAMLPAVMPEPTGTLALPEPTSTSLPPIATPESTSMPAPPMATPELTSTPLPPTAMPEPTSTPVPPTSTPTQALVLPTVTPLPVQTLVPTMEMPSPQPALREGKTAEEVEPTLSRLWTILYTVNSVLPWLEWVLGALVVVLLAITLWLRQAQRLL